MRPASCKTFSEILLGILLMIHLPSIITPYYRQAKVFRPPIVITLEHRSFMFNILSAVCNGDLLGVGGLEPPSQKPPAALPVELYPHDNCIEVLTSDLSSESAS